MITARQHIVNASADGSRINLTPSNALDDLPLFAAALEVGE